MSMRKWIIWIAIILVLAAAGFCIYWFCFRDTSDGGKLSNREVLFAVQSVLENEGANLDEIVENHEKVIYSSSQITNMFVSADGETLKLADRFGESLTTNNGKNLVLSKENFAALFEKPLTYAYSALYNSVFGKDKIRQNTWLEQNIEGKNFKLKIWSDEAKVIYIWLYDAQENIMFETLIDFNYRNETNIYSLESKIVKVNKIASGEDYTYTYGYFNRDAEKVLNFELVNFISKNKIIEKQENYELFDIKIEEISKIDGENKKFISNLSSEKSLEVAKYILEDLDVNFAEYNSATSAKGTKIKTLQNGYNYYNN